MGSRRASRTKRSNYSTTTPNQNSLPTALHKGIGIHHEFGSKTLIDELSAMGHCVSYTEVRHFLTSVAADQISRTERGVYIPTGLTGVAEHGIVDAAIDNFDQNEDTLDGKHTTHAMASVVFRRGQVSTADTCLARVPERSLTTLNTFDLNGDTLHRYLFLTLTFFLNLFLCFNVMVSTYSHALLKI